MLRSFQVTNHRSMAQPQELRLTRSRTAVLPAPVTAIHGAAASGKTSLVDGLAHMRDAVLHSVTRWDPYAGPVRRPHLAHADEPSEFVAMFTAEGMPYTYGFRLDNTDVLAEWLHCHPHNRKRVVFEREGDQVRIGATFEAVRYGIGAIAPLVRPNALLLSLTGQLPAEALMPAYRWFAGRLDIHTGPGDPQTVAHRLGAHLTRSPDHAARLLMLLRSTDTGITDLLIAAHDPAYADYLTELDADITGAAAELDACLNSTERARALEQTHGLTVFGLEAELENLRAARDTLYERMVSRRGVGLGLVHEGIDTPFDIADESAATVALLRLLPPVLDALDTGRVIAIDDIDTYLTGDASDQLIQLFQNPETNSRGAQLLFTTRDRTLVDRGNGRSQTRRTTVWQLRRTATGVSELTPK
ncbi:AAA family ATPase [Nocardia stercoris]|uniref:ATP-binding protein n=1 Tax=Nocardia stercoris TaxID=2483361 RepID=A0A3M2LF45_9NOCA|nr:ATP-binding protein [Nocardia stercoris]RMI35440.1 ATP-binding protein [Nocardia stercoris]